MTILFLFILGLCVGSFLNVLSDRLPNDQSVIKGRSHCDHCKKTLAWYDLVPLLSFVSTQGKCRYCHAHLSYYYPAVELVTAVLFVFLYVRFIQMRFSIYHLPFSISDASTYLSLVYILFVVSALIAILFADLKYGIIPDKILFPAIAVTFLYLLIPEILHFVQNDNFGLILPNLLSGLGAFLFFYLIYTITRGRGMGFGDVKMAFWLGLLLGFPLIIVCLYIAFLTGALISIILVVSRKVSIKNTIPFGPYLVLGALVCLFFSSELTQLFFSYF